MYHDPALAKAAADPRPASAVSTGVGLAGLGGLLAWIALAVRYGMSGPLSALTALVACAVPMVVWSLAVDKVHRNPSTGIDWSNPRPLRATLDISLTKLAGLWATWAAIAAVYGVFRFYGEGSFGFAIACLTYAAPVLVVLSVPWVIWMDRYLVSPRDGAWALGAWLLDLRDAAPDRAAIAVHLRAWAVKGFFLAFMLGVVPGGFAGFVATDLSALARDPVALAKWLVTLMFVVDVAFACLGYMLTFRVLDAHIRSAQPHAQGWAAALICYPPFILMAPGGPLDYHPGTADWTYWLQGDPVAMTAVGATLVALTAVYAWATVAFGLRFSNLTHRGILTHGPYAFSRHPAYLAKNIFWWLSTLPFLVTTGSVSEGVRNAAIMTAVSAVYWWRAKTEERHLGADPAYRAYSDWMARRGPVPRIVARLRG
ncbi:protein-S-isoprenylcysteine methyltransferase [Sphingomonas sp. Leaf33]|uniref:methyltransferase family protein n=1 Tax=Sphingomonas sp. Leaf33 TaxID=1736215 RepID=UPI0006F78F4C|nr:isoprenylcysteine carboxylmethyltransferase family protein [Sphingomonas sp. Leaf33]KQN25379.1 protein-S-isoprenylcysteine methyltransferase [Sphingomonas sp. Leaf33]